MAVKSPEKINREELLKAFKYVAEKAVLHSLGRLRLEEIKEFRDVSASHFLIIKNANNREEQIGREFELCFLPDELGGAKQTLQTFFEKVFCPLLKTNLPKICFKEAGIRLFCLGHLVYKTEAEMADWFKLFKDAGIDIFAV